MRLLQCYLRAAELEMWAAERARTKLRGREADEGQRARDCHTVGGGRRQKTRTSKTRRREQSRSSGAWTGSDPRQPTAGPGRVFSFLPPGTAIFGTRSTDVSSKRKSNQKHEPSDTGARERFGGGNLEQTKKTPRYPRIVPKQLRELSSGAEEPTPFRLDQAYRRNSASGKDEGHLLQTLLRSPGPGWKAARQRGEAAEY